MWIVSPAWSLWLWDPGLGTIQVLAAHLWDRNGIPGSTGWTESSRETEGVVMRTCRSSREPHVGQVPPLAIPRGAQDCSFSGEEEVDGG